MQPRRSGFRRLRPSRRRSFSQVTNRWTKTPNGATTIPGRRAANVQLSGPDGLDNRRSRALRRFGHGVAHRGTEARQSPGARPRTGQGRRTRSGRLRPDSQRCAQRGSRVREPRSPAHDAGLLPPTRDDNGRLESSCPSRSRIQRSSRPERTGRTRIRTTSCSGW
jgi:hypothetical protein